MKFYSQEQSFVGIEDTESHENLHKMTNGELSALCSNLANSCERQYLYSEAKLFATLADYYKAHIPPEMDTSIDILLDMMEWDLAEDYVQANSAAEVANDRGAKRILRWSRNVTRISDAILNRYISEGEAFLTNSSVYICEICGYIYVGDDNMLPAVCPVCRVPNFRIVKVE